MITGLAHTASQITERQRAQAQLQTERKNIHSQDRLELEEWRLPNHKQSQHPQTPQNFAIIKRHASACLTSNAARSATASSGASILGTLNIMSRRCEAILPASCSEAERFFPAERLPHPWRETNSIIVSSD